MKCRRDNAGFIVSVVGVAVFILSAGVPTRAQQGGGEFTYKGAAGGQQMTQTSRPIAQLRAQATALGISVEDAAPVLKVAGVPAQTPKEGGTAIAAFFTAPAELRMSATCEVAGKEVTIPVLRWETGVVVSKDREGAEDRQEYPYPIFDLPPDVFVMGDTQLCKQVCKKSCGGWGACYLSCVRHCTGQGGSGDPRPKK